MQKEERLRIDFPPDIELIDTHVHMWNLQHESLKWSWIDTPENHPIVGNIDSVKSRAFEMEHLETESRFAAVSGFVHVQAALGSPNPVDETRWLDNMSREHPKLKAIIGHADLALPIASEQIDQHLESQLFRGIRDFALEPYLASGEYEHTFEANLAMLAEKQLVLDMDCEYVNMRAAHDLARRHPELIIVLEHIGFPRQRDTEYFAAWRKGVAALAEAPNVVCKLSGMAMTNPSYSYSELRPWVEHCVDHFGPQRLMVGSNWPLDRARGSYDAIMAHTRALISELAGDHSVEILRNTAQRIYTIENN